MANGPTRRASPHPTAGPDPRVGQGSTVADRGDRVRPTRSARLLAGSVVAALFTGACTSGSTGGGPDDPAETEARAKVVSVVDGDTVMIRLAGREEAVRLLGIDAPESVHPTVPVQCFGPEASSRLGELLPPGTAIDVSRDVELRDRFDRLLLYLHRADDGTFVNLSLVSDGYADVAVYEPNSTHVGVMTSARNRARAAGRGLWGVCDGPDQPLQ